MMEEKDEMTAIIKELFDVNEKLKEENKRLEDEIVHLQIELIKARRGARTHERREVGEY
jgi:hypothetical protein